MTPCNDSKYNCGNIIPSACVPFTGKALTFPLAPDVITDCAPNINDVIFVIDKYIKKLVDGNNLTTLDKGCLDFVPATITPAQLHQIEITNICLLKGQVEALQEQLNTLNIGSEIITINLPSCLQPLASPCVIGTNQYQLISILNIFAAKLCDLETRISNLES